MSELYYTEALKLAQKEYRACLSRVASPFLPVMDDFAPEKKALNGIDLGVIQIPAESIVGTRSRGRFNAFAANFMPLLDRKSEFAARGLRMHRRPALCPGWGALSGARRLNDFDSLSHRGLECFNGLLDRYHPSFFIHGHIHKNYGMNIPQRMVCGSTTVVNAYDHCIIEI